MVQRPWRTCPSLVVHDSDYFLKWSISRFDPLIEQTDSHCEATYLLNTHTNDPEGDYQVAIESPEIYFSDEDRYFP
jgi:hypothetical protein